MKDLGLVVFHTSLRSVFSEKTGYPTGAQEWVCSAPCRRTLRGIEARGQTEAASLDAFKQLLRARGFTGKLRKGGSTVCYYCGQNCTQSPLRNEATACKGQRAAWAADAKHEAYCDSKAAADFEERAYGRDD